VVKRSGQLERLLNCLNLKEGRKNEKIYCAFNNGDGG